MNQERKGKASKSPGTWIFIPALAGALIFGGASLRDFNGSWESGSQRVLKVYADKFAHGLPTVCDGLTRHVTKTPIIVGEVWTNEQCEREEKSALMTLQLRLVQCFKRLPPQSVFDMASSHGWNNGVSATCGSAAMRAWNAGDYATGCRRLAFSDGGKPVWSYVRTGRTLPNGKPEMRFVKGLANRRQAEMEVCRQLEGYDPGPAETK